MREGGREEGRKEGREGGRVCVKGRQDPAAPCPSADTLPPLSAPAEPAAAAVAAAADVTFRLSPT
jgi:hypothetical protein